MRVWSALCLLPLVLGAQLRWVALQFDETASRLLPLGDLVRYNLFLEGLENEFMRYNSLTLTYSLVLQRISVGDTASQVLSDVKDYFASPPPGEEPFGLIGFPVDELAADIVSWSTEESILVVGPYSASALFLATPGRIPPYVIGTRASYSDIFEGMLAFLDSVPSLVFNWRNAVVCMSDGSGGPGNEECRTYYEGLKHRRLHVDAFFADSEDELFSIADEVDEQRYDRIWTSLPRGSGELLRHMADNDGASDYAVVGSAYWFFDIDVLPDIGMDLLARTFFGSFFPPVSPPEDFPTFAIADAFRPWRDAADCPACSVDDSPPRIEGYIAAGVVGSVIRDIGFQGTPESFINVAYAVSMPMLGGISLGPLIPEEIASASADPTQNVPFYRSACNNAVRWSWVRSLVEDFRSVSAFEHGIALRISSTCGGFAPNGTALRPALCTILSPATVPTELPVRPLTADVPVAWAQVLGIRGSGAVSTIPGSQGIDVIVGRRNGDDEALLNEILDSGRVVAGSVFDDDEEAFNTALKVFRERDLSIVGPSVMLNGSFTGPAYPLSLRRIDTVATTFLTLASLFECESLSRCRKRVAVLSTNDTEGFVEDAKLVLHHEESRLRVKYDSVDNLDNYEDYSAVVLYTRNFTHVREAIDALEDPILFLPSFHMLNETVLGTGCFFTENLHSVRDNMFAVTSYPGHLAASGEYDVFDLAIANVAFNAAPALRQAAGVDIGFSTGHLVQVILSQIPDPERAATLLGDVLEGHPGVTLGGVLRIGPFSATCRAGPRQALVSRVGDDGLTLTTDPSLSLVFPGCGYVLPTLVTGGGSSFFIIFMTMGAITAISLLIALFIWLAARRRDKRIAEEVIVEEERAAVLQRRLVVSAETERALEDARLLSEQTSKAQTFILKSISQELRSPVGQVTMLSHVLIDNNLTDAQKDLVRAIRTSSAALLTQLTCLLCVATIGQEDFVVDSVPTNVAAMAADIVHGVKGGVERSVVCTTRAERLVMVDERLLRLAVESLVDNAYKFATSAFCVVVDLVPKGSKLIIDITIYDDGLGMEVEGPLFSLFWQQDSSYARKHGGTGLGLALVGRVVSLLEGEVGVASAEGAGSALRIAIPGTPAGPLPPPINARVSVLDSVSVCSGPERVAAAIVGAGPPQRWFTGPPECSHAGRLHVSFPGEPPRPEGLWCEEWPLITVLVAQSTDGAFQRLQEVSTDYAIVVLPCGWRNAVAATSELEARCPGVQRVLVVSRFLFLGDLRRVLLSPMEVRVLVADDDCINLRILSKLFAELGVPVDTVSDGREAKEALERRDAEGIPYQLLLLSDSLYVESHVPVVVMGSESGLARPIVRSTLAHCLITHNVL